MTLAVHLGTPGVAELTKLMTISAKIGIADSARYLKKNRKLVGRLLSPGSYGPDALLEGMAGDALRSRRERDGPAHLHVQPDRGHGDVAAADARGARGRGCRRRGRAPPRPRSKARAKLRACRRRTPQRARRSSPERTAASAIFTARDLAERGMHVVLACRDHARGTAALERIRGELPDADLELEMLDLADLTSVKAFAERYSVAARRARRAREQRRRHGGAASKDHGPGLRAPVRHEPPRPLRAHRQAPRRARRPARFAGRHREQRGRIVAPRSTSTIFRASGSYSPWKAYGASKLANLLFAFELDRRLEAWGMRDPISVAAHPGFATTNLLKTGPEPRPAPVCARGRFGSSRRSPRSRLAAARCRSCTRRPIRRSRAGGSTARPAGGNCAAIRRASHLRCARWTRTRPGGCGRSPKRSRACGSHRRP